MSSQPDICARAGAPHFHRSAVAWLLLLATTGLAQSLEEKVDLLLKQNQEQQQEIEQLKRQLAQADGQSAGDVVAEELHGQILDLALVDERVAKALAEQPVADIPKWLDGLAFKGDVRVRYEGQWFEDNENNPEDRNRGRFRLRFGFDKTWGDDKDWKTAFQLASGGGEPTSTNQSFDDFFSEKPIWITQAYIKWTPQHEWLQGLEMTGGKMPHPFLTTWQHWDADVTPEGVFEKYTFKLFDGAFNLYGNFAQFFVNERHPRPADMSLLVYGGGFDWTLHEESKTVWSFATNYYDYTHVKDNTPAGGGNPIAEVGGREFLAAEDFDILDFVSYLKGNVKLGEHQIPWSLYLDFGFNVDVDEDANDPEYDETFAVGLILGQNKKKGDISVEGGYVRNEPNSVFGFFADADIGFADKRAGVIRAYYSLTDFASIGGSYFSIDNSFFADEDVDHKSLLQLDVNVKW